MVLPAAAAGNRLSVSDQSSLAAQQTLESLLFKATNPSNRLEDVNTIKQFCDAVSRAGPLGASLACRLLAHKIQSPQEREAIQALAALEACVKSCGPEFRAEVGRFKFLNEMIKVVSPRYLAARTPDLVKKKVVELLYLWSKSEELREERKVAEAYSMLKAQGVVSADPDCVGEAVFAASLPPRKALRGEALMSPADSEKLRKLLRSKDAEDLRAANKIIQSMVQEDERRMDAMSKRYAEVTMVENKVRLLNEMLDHQEDDDRNISGTTTSGSESESESGGQDLLAELHDSCVRMQASVVRMASEAADDELDGGRDGDDEDGPEDNGGIVRILNLSDDLSKVIERYKREVKAKGGPREVKAKGGPREVKAKGGAPTLHGHPAPEASGEQLLDILSPANNLADLVVVGVDPGGGDPSGSSSASSFRLDRAFSGKKTVEKEPRPNATTCSSLMGHEAAGTVVKTVDDLLLDDIDHDTLSSGMSPPGTASASALPPLVPVGGDSAGQGRPSRGCRPAGPAGLGGGSDVVIQKSSRQKGLEELDLLGEAALRSHFLGAAPEPQQHLQQQQNPDKNSNPPQFTKRNLSLYELQEQQLQKLEQQRQQLLPQVAPTCPAKVRGENDLDLEPSTARNSSGDLTASPVPAVGPKGAEVKLADLEVELASIRPGATPPLTLADGGDSGLSIILHFGKDPPREHVTAIVVTATSRMSEAVADFEFKAVVPKGCKVKLQEPSARHLPPHSNPFVPPSVITQVMLLANPMKMKTIPFKYVLSYTVDGEPQTEMGEVPELPIC